jgi:hypothetical protein
MTVCCCLLLAAAVWADKPQTSEKTATACHGTAIQFVDSPVVAAQLAQKQRKLVLVLHVSGYFEDPDFT